MSWLTFDFHLVPLLFYVEYCLIAHFYATFRIIHILSTWGQRDGLQKQLTEWQKLKKTETDQSPDTDNVLGYKDADIWSL